MIERELKLSVPPRFHAPDLSGLIDGLTAVPLEPLSLKATYYDTHDLRLIRWGCTLRHRSGEGWTVKLPSTSGTEVLARPEIGFEGAPRHPPAAALELVRAYVRSAPLEVVARMRTLRRTIELRDPLGARLGEVVDDEVSVIDGQRVAERFREFEIELAEGPHGDELLAACRARMEAEGAVTAAPQPKLVRAVGPRALESPEVEAAAVDESSTAGEVVTSAIARSVLRFLHHDPGVVLGDDPEDVHQARVALRRLRSDLRTFGPLLDPDWCDRLRTEASWFGGLLGDVRDAEVLHAALLEDAHRLPSGESAALEALTAQLEARRVEARATLLAGRGGERFVELCDEMVAAAREPALTELAGRPGGEVLPALLARPWKRLRRAADALDAESPDAELHDLRILAKRLRYASEAVAPAIGKRAKRLARGATRLQDVLGVHQDSTIAQAWLREAAEGATPAESFAAGEACARQAIAADRARREWPKAWRRLKGSAARGWLKRAQRALVDGAASPPSGLEPGGELAGEGGVGPPPAPDEAPQVAQHEPVEEAPRSEPEKPVSDRASASGGGVTNGSPP